MKTVKQISLSLENKPGKLAEVSNLLGANGVNITAFYVVAKDEQGVLNFVANNSEKAINILKTNGYNIESQDVIACEAPNHPGGLNAVLKPLWHANINVDYLYPCIGMGELTILILGLDPIEKALKVMEENWIRVFGNNDLFSY